MNGFTLRRSRALGSVVVLGLVIGLTLTLGSARAAPTARLSSSFSCTPTNLGATAGGLEIDLSNRIIALTTFLAGNTNAYATLARNALITLQGQVPSATTCAQLAADDATMRSYGAYWTATVFPEAYSDLQAFQHHLGSLVIIVLALQQERRCLSVDEPILIALGRKLQIVLPLLKSMQTTTSRAQLVHDANLAQTLHPPGFFKNFTNELEQCGQIPSG